MDGFSLVRNSRRSGKIKDEGGSTLVSVIRARVMLVKDGKSRILGAQLGCNITFISILQCGHFAKVREAA